MATIRGFRRWALALAIAWAGSIAHGDVIDWTGGGAPDQNWSTAANWSGTNTPPLPADVARFLNAGAAGAAGTVTNIADGPFGGAIGGIEFQNTTGSFHTTDLGGGGLQVNGDLVVNRDLLTNVVAWFTNGVLSVGSAPSRTNVHVGYLPTADPASNFAGTLNLSGLSQFDATLNQFNIGVRSTSGADGKAIGNVVLAPTNNIDVLNLLLSESMMFGTATPASALTFGSGTNTILADTFTVAGIRGNATATLPSGGVLNLSGSSGPAADLRIGYNAINTSSIAVGTLNTSAGTFNATLDDLIIGFHTSKTGGSGTGTLTLGVNTNVTANRVVLGDAGTHAVDGDGTGIGTLNMAGGTFTVLGDMTMGTGTASSSGTLRMTGGTMNINGSLLDGAGIGRLVLLHGTVNVAGDLTLDSPAASAIHVGLVNVASPPGGTGLLEVHGDFAQIGLPTRRADLYIGRRTIASNVVSRGTVDFSDIDTFTGYFTNLFLGTVTVTGSPEAAAYGTLLLAASYNFVDATTITLADSANVGMGGDVSRLRLSGVNDFVVANLNIGGRKARGELDFYAPGGTLNLSGPGGTRTNIILGNQTTSTAGGSTGTMNLAGSTFNALIGTWVLGSKVNGAAGTTTGEVTMSDGYVDATSIILARRTDAGTGGTVRGIFNFQGGTLVAGSIQRSPANANAPQDVYQFNWTGGTLHVGTYGTAARPMDLLNTGTGTLSPGTPLGQTDIFGNYVQGPNATLWIDLGGYLQGTQYDFVTATGTATIDGALYVAQAAGFLPVPYDTFDVFQASSITLGSSFSILSDYGGGFLYQIIPGQGYEILQLTYVPEPGTLALLGLGLLALARRRRMAKP